MSKIFTIKRGTKRINRIGGSFMRVGIFFGSSTGNTKHVAEVMAFLFSSQHEVVVKDIAETKASDMKGFDLLIWGTSTWGSGELQDDWDFFINNEFDMVDFSGVKIALFGLGDQYGFGDTFVDGMAIIYEKLLHKGVHVLPSYCSAQEYTMTASRGVINGQFVGLALDEDNQQDLTEKRVCEWIKHICNSVEN